MRNDPLRLRVERLALEKLVWLALLLELLLFATIALVLLVFLMLL